MNGGVALCVEVDRRPHRAPAARPATSTSSRPRSTTRSSAASPPSASAARSASGVQANAADVLPELLARGFEADIVTDQTSAHDPLNGYVPNLMSLDEAAALRVSDPERVRERARAQRSPPTARRWSGSSTPAARCSTTATACARRRCSAASSARSPTPGSCPAYVRPLFCEGKGPFRWVALSGDPADIAATDRAVLEEFPDDEPLARWIAHAVGADRLPGPAGADLLARVRRAARGSGCASTRWSRSGELRRRS